MKKENLRPEDIMVGDWVLLFDKTPVRVDCIGNVEVYLTEPRGLHELDWRVTYEHIKPIPLTPEILEKNGFTNVGEKVWQWEEKPFWVWWEEETHHLGIEIDDSSYDEEKSKTIMIIVQNYVHELQHAIKLCGIDKEIVV